MRLALLVCRCQTTHAHYLRTEAEDLAEGEKALVPTAARTTARIPLDSIILSIIVMICKGGVCGNATKTLATKQCLLLCALAVRYLVKRVDGCDGSLTR
jgi:hypothetical protein